MPIHPEDRDRYPSDWPEISRRIRFDRAGGKCECTGQCGNAHGVRCDAPHNMDVLRFADREQDWELWERVSASGRLMHRKVRIILTVAHLDHTPEHCDDDNLLAMCQRCHLRYDRDHHAASRRRRRDQRSGQLPLLGELPKGEE